ncbi:MAG: IS110 family transposase [Desulfitobacterium hafniense]|nr:IS110 family transposase [Desulfitobacterium hafniense]
MEIVHQRCCGLDVHKNSITSCIITPEGKEVKTYSTMTDSLLELVDEICNTKCTGVAMESTSVFWKPIYNLLEGLEIETMVVNARHIKAVPGRKTDVKDAEWIAELLQHGLLKGSYIPDRENRELREMVRYRKSLIYERSREINRMQKVMEGANIKLSSVVSKVNGKSAQKIIDAMISGEQDIDKLNDLANNNVKSKGDTLKRALKGLMGKHQQEMLSMQKKHIEFLDSQINDLNDRIHQRMLPFAESLELVDTIPGVGMRTAEEVIAEIGTDMSRWPTAAHLVSWAGLSPGDNESAGKRKSTRTRKGNKHIRAALVESANSIAHSKDKYLCTKYSNIVSRRGKKKAAVAVAREILISIYHIIKKKQPYIELGSDYLTHKNKEAIVKKAIKKIESLGYEVEIKRPA